MKTIAFIVLLRDGRPYLVRRGEYIGLPCTEMTGGESLRQVAARAVPGVHFYRMGPIREIGRTYQHHFDGERVEAVYIELPQALALAPNGHDGSYDFDRRTEKPDIFLLRYEEKGSVKACAA